MPELPKPNKRTLPRQPDRVRSFLEEVEIVDPQYRNRETTGYQFSNGRIFSDKVTRRNRY